MAVVTGASSGIGAAFAARLAAEGHDLVLVARRADRLQAVAERLSARHAVEAAPFVCDLTDPQALHGLEDRLAGEGRLAVLVNNAGIGTAAPFLESSPEALEAMVELHVTAVVRLARAALPGMVARGRGTVINVASGAVFAADPGLYGATKALVVELTRALRAEVQGSGVVLQALCPGYVHSEIYARLGRAFPVPEAVIMAPEALVTASLAGLARGELLCLPSLDDATLLDELEALRAQVLARLESRATPAPRYGALELGQ